MCVLKVTMTSDFFNPKSNGYHLCAQQYQRFEYGEIPTSGLNFIGYQINKLLVYYHLRTYAQKA